MIHLECYLSKLKSMKNNHPEAHFEVITRTAKHILSPSPALVKCCVDHRLEKNEEYPFVIYTMRLFREWGWNERPDSRDFHAPVMRELERLRILTRNKELYLVCYETNPEKCHRSIVKRLMEGDSPQQILDKIKRNGHCL